MKPYPEYRDEQLVSLLTQGDTGAFDELYSRYSRRLLAFFNRMFSGNTEKAEDALQDIFLKIIERPVLFDTRRNFSTWLFSVAYNMCKNEYKHQSVRTNAFADLKLEGTATKRFFSDSISEKIDRKTFLEMLDRELRNLGEEKRGAFLLKYQDHKSIREIAQIMNCSEGTVKSRIFYASRHLARQLAIFNPTR